MASKKSAKKVDTVDTFEEFIRLNLAALSFQGYGTSAPNPCVAAIFTLGKQIIAGAHSARGGGPHAEAQVIDTILKKLNPEQVARGRLYVTLEPCSHHGKNPPCAVTIAEAGIKKVSYVFTDPDERVSGRGAALLRRRRVKVEQLKHWQGFFEPYFAAFFMRVKTGRPRLLFKTAETADGCMADSFGYSGQITSPAAGVFVHRLRAMSDVILVGAATFLNDRPHLGARNTDYKTALQKEVNIEGADDLHYQAVYSKLARVTSPDRYILFADMRQTARAGDAHWDSLWPDNHQSPVFFILQPGSLAGRAAVRLFKRRIIRAAEERLLEYSVMRLENDGKVYAESGTSLDAWPGSVHAVNIFELPAGIDSAAFCLDLAARRGALNIMIEGGGKTLAAFRKHCREGDLWYRFTAPLLLGGRAVRPFDDGHAVSMNSRIALERAGHYRFGPDSLELYRWPAGQ